MKAVLHRISAEETSEMHKSKLSIFILFLMLIFATFNLKASDNSVKSCIYPIQVTGSVNALQHTSTVSLSFVLENPEKVVAVRVVPLNSGQSPIKETQIIYRVGGRVDVDIIIRVAADSEIDWESLEEEEIKRIVVGYIEVITVDNISGVAPNDNTSNVHRTASNGVNPESNNPSNLNNNNSNQIIAELLPVIENSASGAIKLNSTELSGLTNIYPNPSIDGVVRVNSKVKGIEIQQILVYNAMGGLMKNYINNDRNGEEILLELSGLTKGVYFVNIKTELGETTKKLNILK
jgi:hypothetical protein